MRLLYCDPSQTNLTTRSVVELSYGECPGEALRHITLNDPRSETLLQAMAELVGSDELHALVLVNRAQSFTLIRVLATLYNALAYSRKLVLYELTQSQPFFDLAAALGHQTQSQITPHYIKAPNITYAAQSRK